MFGNLIKFYKLNNTDSIFNSYKSVVCFDVIFSVSLTPFECVIVSAFSKLTVCSFFTAPAASDELL